MVRHRPGSVSLKGTNQGSDQLRIKREGYLVNLASFPRLIEYGKNKQFTERPCLFPGSFNL